MTALLERISSGPRGGAPSAAPASTGQHVRVLIGLAGLGVIAYYLLTHLTGSDGQAWLLVVLWTVAITGLNVVQGLGGYPSLAQAAFYGGGAYISTILLHHGLAMPLAALLAVLLTTAAGLVVALVFARSRGQYFAIGTLFFGAVITLVFNNSDKYTGGPNGTPVDLGFTPTTTLRLLAASMTLGFVVFYIIRRTKLGSRLLAIKEDEDLADHLGVPTARTKLIALVLSSVFGAWSGVLLAQYDGVIAPTQFTFQQGFLMFVAVGLGGYGRLLTPLLGSAIVVGLPQVLNLGPGTSQIAIGVIFVAVTLALPGGILGGLDLLWQRVRPIRRRDEVDTVPRRPTVESVSESRL